MFSLQITCLVKLNLSYYAYKITFIYSKKSCQSKLDWVLSLTYFGIQPYYHCLLLTQARTVMSEH